MNLEERIKWAQKILVLLDHTADETALLKAKFNALQAYRPVIEEWAEMHSVVKINECLDLNKSTNDRLNIQVFQSDMFLLRMFDNAYMDTIDFDKGMLKPEEDDKQWEAWTNGDSCLIYCDLGAEINFENYFYPVPDI